MSHRDTVMHLLQGKHPLCDDCISAATGIVPRSSVYKVCRTLANKGEIHRRSGICCGNCRGEKLVNSLVNNTVIQQATEFHEGNIYSANSARCEAMNLAVQIVNLRLTPVHLIKKGHLLVKGGEKKNSDICRACKKVGDKNLCYYWKTADSILYVGSATERKGAKGTLLSRILNYLQTHSGQPDKSNQNKRIFDLVNKQLVTRDVEFGRFEFDLITARDYTIHYSTCAEQPEITIMFEHILIGYFRLTGQATWNL